MSSNQDQKPKQSQSSTEPPTQPEQSAHDLKQTMDKIEAQGEELEERIIECMRSTTTDAAKRKQMLADLEERLREIRQSFAETGRKWQEKTGEARAFTLPGLRKGA